VLYLLGVSRGLIHRDLCRMYSPGRQRALLKARRFDIWAGPVVGLVHWLGVLGSMFGRHIRWRGISYRVFRSGQVREILDSNTLRQDGSDRQDQQSLAA